MDLVRPQTNATESGSADWFTGDVWLDEIVVAKTPSRLRVHRVTFAPGARTRWHDHPIGQVLHGLAGVGRVQREGEHPREIRPGDTVQIQPRERHWHGAAPNHLFVHLAVQEAAEDGTEANWFDPVEDGEYLAPIVEESDPT